jgi:hypothetical protein
VTGSGARQSMFHNVTTRIVRPMMGSASNPTSNQAATSFHSPLGIVKTTRHHRYATRAPIAVKPPTLASQRLRADSGRGEPSRNAQPARLLPGSTVAAVTSAWGMRKPRLRVADWSPGASVGVVRLTRVSSRRDCVQSKGETRQTRGIPPFCTKGRLTPRETPARDAYGRTPHEREPYPEWSLSPARAFALAGTQPA